MRPVKNVTLAPIRSLDKSKSRPAHQAAWPAPCTAFRRLAGSKASQRFTTPVWHKLPLPTNPHSQQWLYQSNNCSVYSIVLYLEHKPPAGRWDTPSVEQRMCIINNPQVPQLLLLTLFSNFLIRKKFK